ncbi:LysR family transcriptional regulator [Alicyclobacillaceae bacterium I2511]|nr:LysR family transcriptional regulator [Alicyclobacillaceae bacterium I2511]
MEIRALEYFLAVADHGNVTRAAQFLRISQPAVSQVIKSLEIETGQTLFHRTPGGVTLTEAGKLLRHHALKVIHEVQDAEEALHTVRNRSLQLRIGVLPTLAHDYVPAILRTFLQSEQLKPGKDELRADIGVVQASTRELIRRVQTGDLHLAVLDLPISEPSLSVARLWRERLVIIAPVDAPPLPNPVTLSQLQEQTFITMEPDYGLRDALFRAALDSGFQPRVMFELKSVLAIVGFVQAGFGISLVSARTVALETQLDRLQLADTSPALARDIGLIWRGDRRLPAFPRKFQEYLIEQTQMWPKEDEDLLI